MNPGEKQPSPQVTGSGCRCGLKDTKHKVCKRFKEGWGPYCKTCGHHRNCHPNTKLPGGGPEKK